MCIWYWLKKPFFLLFSLFLLLSMGLIALLGIIHKSHCIISPFSFIYSTFFFFVGFPRYSQVFIPGLILRGTLGNQGGDLSQESLLHPQGLETETTCLSNQSPFHSGQPSLVYLQYFQQKVFSSN